MIEAISEVGKPDPLMLGVPLPQAEGKSTALHFGYVTAESAVHHTVRSGHPIAEGNGVRLEGFDHAMPKAEDEHRRRPPLMANPDVQQITCAWRDSNPLPPGSKPGTLSK